MKTMGVCHGNGSWIFRFGSTYWTLNKGVIQVFTIYSYRKNLHHHRQNKQAGPLNSNICKRFLKLIVPLFRTNLCLVNCCNWTHFSCCQRIWTSGSSVTNLPVLIGATYPLASITPVCIVAFRPSCGTPDGWASRPSVRKAHLCSGLFCAAAWSSRYECEKQEPEQTGERQEQ